MELVVENPFRVLGLPATATSRDIAKRVSDLETFAELGRTKTYGSDLPFIGRFERTVEAVKAAAKKIEQAESKLFHSFFWFRAGQDSDVVAMTALATGDYPSAMATWNEELSKGGQRRYSSRLNRAVLKLWLATKGEFDRRKYSDALVDIGFVIDDHLDESIDAVLGVASAGLNREALWKRVVDSLVQIAQAPLHSPYGTNAMAMVSDCWSFPQPALDYVKARVTNPVIERIETAVAASGRRRSNALVAADLNGSAELKEIEPLLLELQLALGDEDARFQAVANKYAEELCSCAIAAYNQFKDLELASSLIEWTATLPSFSRTKARIADNKKTLDGNIALERSEALRAPLLKLLENSPRSMVEAKERFEAMKRELARVHAIDGVNEDHLAAGSACVSCILGFLIDTVNAAQETPPTSATLPAFTALVTQAAALTRDLLGVDMEPGIRERLRSNIEVLEGLERTIQAIWAAQKRSFWESIPGWVWILAIIILIGMFK